MSIIRDRPRPAPRTSSGYDRGGGFRPGRTARPDRNILAIADKEGIYRPPGIWSRLSVPSSVRAAILPPTSDPMSGAWRRCVQGGHVERIDADQWRIPADLPERGRAYDLARDRTKVRSIVSRPLARAADRP